MTQVIVKKQREPREKGVPRVAVVVGTCFGSSAVYPAITGADAIIWLDVPAELNAVRAADGVHLVPLARRETLHTLLADGNVPEVVKEILTKLNNISAGSGLAQFRLLGGGALGKLLKDPAFHSLLEDLFNDLLRLHEGEVERVEITVYSSTAGGTGGPGAQPVGLALAETFLERSQAVVHVWFVRVGALSFVGCGDRVASNSAATVEEDLELLTAAHRHERLVLSAVYVEMPMVGRSKTERDKLVGQFTQALRCSGMVETVDRTWANQALDSRYGAFSLLRAGYWHGISDYKIAAEVADHCLPRLKRLAETGPRDGLVDQIEVALEERQLEVLGPEEVVDLTRRSREVEPAGYSAICLGPTVNFLRGAVSARLADGALIDLTEKLGVHFAAAARTEAEISRKLTLLRTLDGGLTHQIDDRRGRMDVLNKERAKLESDFRKLCRLLFPTRPWERLQAAVASPRTNIARLRNAVTRGREVANKAARCEAELQLLRTAHALVAAEYDAEVKRLRGMIDAMTPFRQGKVDYHATPVVEIVGFDEVLARLAELPFANAPDLATICRLLGSCAKAVTLAGLAEVFGAPERRLESIARKIVTARPPMEAPFWGATRPLTQGHIVTVLPPVGAQLEQELQQAVRSFDEEVEVVSADSAVAGVNAVRLDFFEARHREEIITQYLGAALREARKEPSLYFTNESFGNGGTANAPNT